MVDRHVGVGGCVLALLTGCAATGMLATDGTSAQEPRVWLCARTATPPRIDGQVEQAWKAARPLTVTVREAIGGGNPARVELRALRTGDTLFVLARWPDATRSDMRDPYVWNAKKKAYERPSRPDDQFAIEFPLRGRFDVDMLTVAHDYETDVWHWKAGRGNPVGWADDKRHIIGQRPVPKAKQYVLGGHGTVYIARLADAGTTAYAVKPAPTSHQGDVVDSFLQRTPTGSVADVRAKGVHDGKGWTLELARRLDTGHADDAVIDPRRDTPCAIAVLNDELYWRHSVSGVIVLRFAGEPTVRSFDDLSTGGLPPGWKIDATNPKGPLATWGVVPDAKAPSRPNTLALSQVRDGSRGVYNLCWTDTRRFQDGSLEVKVRGNSGRIDQGGGPIWRVQDARNYYIARYNPLERNFRLYIVRNGRRRQLASAGGLSISTGQWFTIKIVHRGETIEGWLDGKKLLDTRHADLPQAGGVGLWTKADAATSFDDLSIQPEAVR